MLATKTTPKITATKGITGSLILLRKRNKILEVPKGDGCPPHIVATLNKNLESLGYTLSKEAWAMLQDSSTQAVYDVATHLVADLRAIRGANKRYNPMYPNFPQQVMDMSDAELYINAMVHYWSVYVSDVIGQDVSVLPESTVLPRESLKDKVPLEVIGVGTQRDLEEIYTQIVASNGSLTAENKEMLEWFAKLPDISSITPAIIPQKETLAILAALLGMPMWLADRFSSATDVLRVAVVMSGGDVSLAKPTKFIKFNRACRRAMLAAIDRQGYIVEDMLRRPMTWVRLGEILHPGEYSKRFVKAFAAFQAIRHKHKISTFASQVETALSQKAVPEAVELLVNRPGEFARRLDHLLRSDVPHATATLLAFEGVSDKVATPVLMQVYDHFLNRSLHKPRVIFPKGQTAKFKILDDYLPALSEDISIAAANCARSALVDRFRTYQPLGKCYVSESMLDYVAPFAMRSASKALKTLTRGSRVSFGADGNVIRFFLWWKNSGERVDIDLSCRICDEAFNVVSDVAFYRLRDSNGITHSGDITNAPNGACEFIDVDIPKLPLNSRYVIMQLNSFTRQPFNTLPECFAGWMMREDAHSGEIFDARTVANKIDLACESLACMPVVIDVVDRKVIWADTAIGGRRTSTLHDCSHRINKIAEAMLSLVKPRLYDLFVMHAEARGVLVDQQELADVSFVERPIQNYTGRVVTPFDIELIMSEFMA